MNRIESKTFGEFLDILTDYTANGSFESLKQNVKYYTENNYAVLVRTTDLEKNVFKPARFTNKRGYDFLKKTSLYGGEIVLANVGSVGKVYKVPYYNKPMTLAPNTYLVRFNNEVDNEYIYQFLKSHFYIKELFKNIGSTTLQAINKDNFRSINFYFHPLPQQKKIAKILSTVDNVIEKTESAIAKYQAIKQGLIHDLFTRGIDVNTGKLRPTPQEAPELYKESALGLIPRDWQTDELINLTKLVTDGAHFSPVPQEKGLPIGNVKDMRDSNFDYDKCTKILPEVFKLLVRQNCSPMKGDVLLSKDGTIGKVIHFEDDREIVLLSSIAIIRVNELLDSRYLSWALESEYFDKALYALLSGSALKRITLKDILKIRLPFSKDLEEQKLIASRLQKSKDKIQTEQQALAKYQQLKAGLLQDLLTGKVEVNADETALNA